MNRIVAFIQLVLTEGSRFYEDEHYPATLIEMVHWLMHLFRWSLNWVYCRCGSWKALHVREAELRIYTAYCSPFRALTASEEK